ncbi:MAG: hypothetical protein N2593_01975 [Patescibacteria group bacterium]|nr:hypothetical protein [Patescibacteria group bacterium]
MKKLTLIITFIFFSISLYYLGSLNILNRLINNSKKKSFKSIIPTITLYPIINQYNNLKMTDSGKVLYKDNKFGISFQFPQNFNISGSLCYIKLSRFTPIIHSPMWNEIRIIIQEKNGSQCYILEGYYEEKPLQYIFDYNNSVYYKISNLNINETISISEQNPEYFTYTRLPDKIMGKNKVKHFVSYLVWESSKNTVEHIYQINSDKNIVWVDGLINEDISQSDSISFKTFQEIVSSILLD